MIRQVVKVDFFLSEFEKSGDEILPDFYALEGGEIGVVEGELNARFKGFVEGADAVRGEN